MKALGIVVSDKKIFENCILKTYFLTLWLTYATDWNNLNNFGRGPPRDHSCEVFLVKIQWDVSEKKMFKWIRGPKGPWVAHLRKRSKVTVKALGLVVSNKKVFESCIMKIYFLTPWPTYATNQNHLNNFGRGPARDHSCWVWSNSH